MHKYLAMAVAALLFGVAAQAKDLAFPMSGWDKYDGSERLGAIQEACQDDAWPKGSTPEQASASLATMSSAQGKQLAESCDPEGLAIRTAGTTARTWNRNNPNLPAGYYYCYVDALGRHKVAAVAEASGICRGPKAGSAD